MFSTDKAEWEKLERQTLSAIPTLVGRLVYLSSLRDFNTGYYHHAGWATADSEEEVDKVLRQVHQELFNTVLDAPLKVLVEDLERFFSSGSSAGPDITKALKAWREAEAYRILPPLGSHPIDRELFCSRLKAGLGVLTLRASFSPQAQ